ncbi:Palmitoyltransferase swf1 [Neolecta irregularis DAH-3]|uniref:Palmitoyltransferase n=1 Tax=Neolecta irregularis (strain DAH-3) TaxID=1198029 RepID=A0A1U7LW54_NEOID|nr:Palmitoyltransferase swf1 [Neolecta irregularis DAH-3]|eukprot:OLL26897.1 Palmitoyltransferase swf1 [Neolecta irregularis DAH-3]
MGFYLTLVTCGSGAFVFELRWHLPSPKIGIMEYLMILIVILLPYITLYYASTTDPGFITKENHRNALRIYPFDCIIFHPRNTCRTCKFEKPARSKHCSLCKTCVAKMDHHCAWINNCVGMNNTRYFLVFIGANLLYLLYGFWIVSRLITGIVEATSSSRVDVDIPPDVGQYQLWWDFAFYRETLGALLILTGLLQLVVVGFLIFQLYLIYSGTTTNESMKWDDVKEAIKYKEIMIFEGGPEEAYAFPREDIILDLRQRRVVAIDEHGRASEQIPIGSSGRLVKHIRELVNIYDRGWKNNYWDVWKPKKL